MADKPLDNFAQTSPAVPDGVVGALSEMQTLINQQRDEMKQAAYGIGDARWMLWMCAGLFVPVVGIYFVFPADEADIATQFIQIVGLVLAGWGATRVFYAPKHSRVKKASIVYLPVFLVFFLIYGQLLMSGVSLRYAPNLVQMFQRRLGTK
jgi:hypothetical protein